MVHKRSQKYLVVKDGKQKAAVLDPNINSTTLQDYSEYQLSFRQDTKSSVTPLDNILGDEFSAR